MKSCKKCGCVNDSINRYCRNCGAPFEESAPAPEKPECAPDEAALPTAEKPAPDAADPFFCLTDIGSEPVNGDVEAPASHEGGGAVSGTLDTADLVSVIDRQMAIGAAGGQFIDFDLSPKTDEIEERVQVKDTRYSTHPVIHAAKRACCSPVFLAYCILSTVILILRGVGMFSRTALGDISTVFEMTFSGSGFSLSNGVYTLMSVGVSCASLLPAVLILAGMWALFCAGRDRTRNHLATGGLSLVSAGCIVNIVYLSVICALTLLVIPVGLSVYYAQPDSATLGSVMFFGVMLAAAVTGIVYFSFCLASAGRIRRTARTGEAHYRLSLFVVVCNLALCVVYASFIGLFLAYEDMAPAVLCALSMAELILLSVSMLRYRSVMKELAL